jgi:transcriptional regulator with XRE-family HTH domain
VRNRDRGDTDIGIEVAPRAADSDLISVSVSPPASVQPLPDFLALLRAELAAAEAVGDQARSGASSLGAGEIVLTARELAGYSQRRLATELGSSQPAVAAIESGKRMPTIRTLIRVAEAAGLELVVGLRRPGAEQPVALGALVSNADDGLADFLPMRAPSPFDGPPDR